MKSSIPLQILNFGEDHHHILVQIKINNKPAHLVVDTGASATAFDVKRLKRYSTKMPLEHHHKLSTGLGTNEMKSHLIILKKIQIGDLIIKDFASVALDLCNVNFAYKSSGIKPIDGVLGGDILFKYKAVINYKKLILQFKLKK